MNDEIIEKYDDNLKTLGSMCFRYVIHIFILSYIVNLGTIFLAAILANSGILNTLNSLFALVIAFLLLLGVSFLSSYLLSRWTLHDCFLKKRTISKNDEKKFLLFITIIYPIISFILSFILRNDKNITFFDLLSLVLAGLAAFLNRKLIKTS